MNHLSNYAYQVIKRAVIISLLLGISLTLAVTVPMIRRERDVKASWRALYEKQVTDSRIREQALEDTITDLRELVTEVYDKYQLIAAQIEAGFHASTVEEMRILLQEADKMPFGTPFANGHRVTAEYGVYTINKFGWLGVNHPGIDIVPLDGDGTIYSPVDGVITDFGVSDIWGKWIEVTTEAGYQLFFAHLSVIYWQTRLDNGNWTLTPGTPIKKGTRIAEMGMTGAYATGPHLHYEIRTKSESGDWVTMDPKAIISWTGAIEEADE